jgi:hypothetical protein
MLSEAIVSKNKCLRIRQAEDPPIVT